MKIGLIGLGYWGKIILNNLIKMCYNNITICDNVINPLDSNLGNKFKFVNDYKKVNCDKVFIVVPTTKHYEIVKYFLEKKVDVFCEKPLTIKYDESLILYDIAKKNNTRLFVDWIFTFNTQIIELKNLIKKHNLTLKNVIFNRMNFGPERFDVNSVYDLSSHDISIITFLFGKEPISSKWLNFKRNNNPFQKQNDSSVGVLKYDNFTVQINSSWYYGEKFRKCYFEFEEGFIYWDDMEQTLSSKIDSFEIKLNNNESPLERSLKSFLTDEFFDYEQQKEITLITQKIIDNNDKI